MALGGQKNSNMAKEPSFRAPSGVLICLLKIILTNRLLLETDFLDRFKESTSEVKLVFLFFLQMLLLEEAGTLTFKETD